MARDASRPLAGRIALVTGASRGIGYATAFELAMRGAHVIACARTVGGLEQLDDAIKAAGAEPVSLSPFDLRDHGAIDRLGAAIHERFGRLDILIGNAGVLGVLTPVAHLEPKTFAELLDVNVTANYRLIRSMDPNLQAAPAARVVFVTSGLARAPRAYWGGYAMSKAALEVLAKTYALETATTRIRVSLFNPGRTRTAMRSSAMPGEDKSTQTDPTLVAAAIADHLGDTTIASGAEVSFDADAAKASVS